MIEISYIRNVVKNETKTFHSREIKTESEHISRKWIPGDKYTLKNIITILFGLHSKEFPL